MCLHEIFPHDHYVFNVWWWWHEDEVLFLWIFDRLNFEFWPLEIQIFENLNFENRLDRTSCIPIRFHVQVSERTHVICVWRNPWTKTWNFIKIIQILSILIDVDELKWICGNTQKTYEPENNRNRKSICMCSILDTQMCIKINFENSLF